jgi:predicted DNA-binding transcriptional regulator AlpA
MTENASVNPQVVEAMEPLLTVKDLETLFRVHRRTITRLVERGRFPAPIKIGESCRWTRSDINKVLERPEGLRAKSGGPVSRSMGSRGCNGG